MPVSKKKKMTESVTFQFDNIEAAQHFKDWMCGSGEQQYWEWMEHRENDEDGDITGIQFKYDDGPLVIVKCGRFSGESNE